jgi:hypothetical protein
MLSELDTFSSISGNNSAATAATIKPPQKYCNMLSIVVLTLILDISADAKIIETVGTEATTNPSSAFERFPSAVLMADFRLGTELGGVRSKLRQKVVVPIFHWGTYILYLDNIIRPKEKN